MTNDKRNPKDSLVQLWLEPEIKSALKVLATKDDRSLAAYAAMILRKHIESEK